MTPRDLLDAFVKSLPTTLRWTPEMRRNYERLDRMLARQEEKEPTMEQWEKWG